MNSFLFPTQIKTIKQLTGKTGVLLVVIIFSFLMSACGIIDQDVTVYEDENWKAETRVGLTPEELSMMGESEIVSRLNRQQSTAQAAGTNYQWNRKKGDDNRIYYIVTASGSGYDLLNQLVFDGDATIGTINYDGQEAIQFTYTSSYELAHYGLQLSTGEVLESNGVQSGKGQVSWEGAGRTMQAVFSPKSAINWPLVIIITVVIIVLGGALILFAQIWRRQQKHQTASFTTNFCHRCGGRLDSTGTFCPHCGAPRL